MKFTDLLAIIGDEPIFETGLLLAGEVDAADVRRQLSRWVKAGRLYQLRRGLYAPAPPFQKVKPHPFVVANHLVRGSYVSCQSALAHYGLIPEYTPVVISVTAARPGRRETPFGIFEFRHIQPKLLRGYRQMDLGSGQKAFVATPEKALLDLIYLHPGADSPDYLREQATLVSILAVGQVTRDGEIYQGVPLLAAAVNAAVETMSPGEIRHFHAPSGRLSLAYMPRLLAEKDVIAPHLLLKVVEQLIALFPDQKRQLAVLRGNLAWKAVVTPAG
jgi:hypothetical protein